MAMHMRKECKERESQRTINNITYGGQHFPVLYHSMFTLSAGLKLVLMKNIELAASYLTDRT